MASLNEKIVIDQVLNEFKMIDAGKSVILESKLSDHLASESVDIQWYKNSEIVKSSNKAAISNHALWQKLKLRHVTKQDEGVYCLAVKSTAGDVYTKCNIYIKPLVLDQETYHFPNSLGENVGVTLKLRSCAVAEGEEVKLKVIFSTNVQRCLWYRNDHIISSREPHVLIKHSSDERSSELMIINATKNDTGLYSVIAKTKQEAYLCSYADVLVASDYVNTLFNNNNIPHICKTSTDYMKFYEMDDVRLIFKVNFDSDTIIEWTKLGVPVYEGDRITCETYDSAYIALRLLNVKISDSGEYTLLVKNKISSIVEKLSTELTVIAGPSSRPSPCKLIECLKPAIASIGNRVTFRCSFHIGDLKQIFVVWLIGRYTVKRSHGYFKVICDGNDFIFHITSAVPEMAGKVTCQLRQALSPGKSILITKTSSILAIVPSQIIEEEKIRGQIMFGRNIYFDENVKISIPGLNVLQETPSFNEIIMDLQFCKLSGGAGYLFEVGNGSEKADVNVVNVFKNKSSKPHFQQLADWTIDWDRTQTPKELYAVDLFQSNGIYTEIGISSSSKIDIKEPPEDKIFKFRIRTLRPSKKIAASIFCFVAEEVATRETSASKEIRCMREYTTRYETKLKIGRGTFGVVNLVRNQNGLLFAAKNIKFEERYKWERALKEFEIMKSLVHPNTVALIDAFAKKNRNGLVFVMEYLWGGTLTERTIEDDKLAEVDVIVYVRQILSALQYIHSMNLVHLDVKPDNVICVNPNSKRVKLVDYRTARFTFPASVLPLPGITQEYMSPELIHGDGIGTYCDMWSLGVLTYYLLSRKLPFVGSSWMELSRYISHAEYYYRDPSFGLISERAKSFVNDLLQRKYNDRSTATRSLTDKWIVEGPGDDRPWNSRTEPFNAQFQLKLVSNVALAIVRFRASRR